MTHVRDVVGNHVTVIDAPERIEEPIIKVSYFTQPEKQEKATQSFVKNVRMTVHYCDIGKPLGRFYTAWNE